MTTEELSDEQITTDLLIREIRRLNQAIINERKQKAAAFERYEIALEEKRKLEAEAVVLKAEIAQLKARPKFIRQDSDYFLGLP